MNSDSLNINRLFSLEGKIAVVTGGSRGIGYMIAQGLLEAGATVYITARKEQPCIEAAKSLSEYGKCFALAGDVANADDRAALVARLQAEESALHILVNNAGTSWGQSFEEYSEAGFNKVMQINVNSVFALTRDLAPLLKLGATEEDPARVINIGSMEGLHIPSVHALPNFAYTTSKAAVHHLTKHLAVELGAASITVNAIAPGFFPSQMTKHLFAGDELGIIENNSLLGRVGKAEEMAGIAIYLSSMAGAYTTGTVIPVDGGTVVNYQHGGQSSS